MKISSQTSIPSISQNQKPINCKTTRVHNLLLHYNIKMPPFSSFFDFVSHHSDHHHRHHLVSDDDDSCSDMDISSSSIHSTFSTLTSSMKRPLPSSKKDTRKKVSFFDSVKVQLIEPVDDYSAEERSSCWYDRDELNAMKHDRRETVKVMEEYNFTVDDSLHYFRGLEFKTRRGAQQKQWNIVESSMEVFDEQMHQINTMGSIVDQEAIAQAYRSVTTHSMVAAIERGLFDQKVAFDTSIVSKDTTTGVAVACVDTTPRMPPRRLSCRAA